MPLPQGRSTVTDGTLNISNFSPQDVGPYQCKATNKLGSVTALTTLHYVQGKNQLWKKRGGGLLELSFQGLTCIFF